MKIHLVRHGKPDFWRDYSAWTFLSGAQTAQAAAILTTRARQHGDVMLVGHGWMNYLICSRLKREGWQANSAFKRHYWDCNTLAAPHC